MYGGPGLVMLHSGVNVRHQKENPTNVGSAVTSLLLFCNFLYLYSCNYYCHYLASFGFFNFAMAAQASVNNTVARVMPSASLSCFSRI